MGSGVIGKIGKMNPERQWSLGILKWKPVLEADS